MINNEIKINSLLGLLEVVKGISDLNYQIRVWIQGVGPECDDFDETVNNFVDFEECIKERYKEYEMTVKQRDIYIKFRDLFREFADDNDFVLDFDAEKWQIIMDLAKEVLKAFDDHPYVVEARKAGQLPWENRKDF